MANINGSNVTALESQSRSASKPPRRAALALVVSLVLLAFNTSCLATAPRSQAWTCPCFAPDPLERVPGVVTAHRLEDDEQGWEN